MTSLAFLISHGSFPHKTLHSDVGVDPCFFIQRTFVPAKKASEDISITNCLHLVRWTRRRNVQLNLHENYLNKGEIRATPEFIDARTLTERYLFFGGVGLRLLPRDIPLCPQHDWLPLGACCSVPRGLLTLLWGETVTVASGHGERL